MPSVKNIISAHNKRLLNEDAKHHATQENTCNCRRKNNCPLEGKCQSKEIVYQATAINEDNNTQETYIGLTEGAFKTRYLNHTSSISKRKIKKRHRTEQTHLVFEGIKHAVFHRIGKSLRNANHTRTGLNDVTSAFTKNSLLFAILN